MTTYRASDIFKVKQLTRGRAGVPFLNWAVKCKPLEQRSADSSAFEGPGLFGLCFNKELICVGSFLGSKATLDGGDVAERCWVSYITSITARGHKLHLAPNTLKRIQQHPDNGDGCALADGLNQGSDLLFEPEGNLAPFRRLMFAARHHNTFLSPDAVPEDVLGRFNFVYLKAPKPSNDMDRHAIAAMIEETEIGLIQQWAPACNTSNVPQGAEPVRVELIELEELLAAALAETFAQFLAIA